MIGDILFSWNALTVTIAVWLGLVCVAVAADVGPSIYREEKARQFMVNHTMQLIAKRKAAERVVRFDSGEAFSLGVFNIQPEPSPGRHARV